MENRINLQPASSSAVISQKQSLELVRILIITVFSGVLWRRRVFPGVRYKFRVFDPADPRASYDTFVNEGGQTSTADFNCWPILPRSQDPRTEKLLNLLENGVKEALEIGTLSRLQLSFHSSNGTPASADNLLESYTLGFAYRDGIELTELTTEISNSANKKTTFSVSTVKQQVEYINHQLQCLMQTTRNNSELLGPGRFRMFLRMKYVGNDDFCPTGFHQDQESLQLLNDAHLDLNMRMITGHHSILAGTSLPVKPVARSVSSTFAITSRLRVASKADLNAIEADQHQSSSQSTQTQPGNVEKVGTMGIVRYSTDPRSTQLLNASSLSASRGSHAAANNEHMLVDSTQYGQDVIELIKQNERSQSPDTNSQEESFADACECGVNLLHEKIEFQLARTINCELCGGHRHLECYGYLDENFPEAFVCYSCLKLNFPEHRATLKRATSLCVRRRVLNYFLNQGPLMAIKDLAQFTGSNSKRIISILNTMKREKILAGSEKRKPEGRPLFTLVDPENLTSIRDKYFNPRIGMEIFMSQPTHLAQNVERDIPSTPHQQLASPKYLSRPSRIQQLAPTEDDDSTQGVPSPQLADRRSQTLRFPVKPADKTHEDDLPLGTKRKTTPTKDNVPKRVKLAHATPLMSRRVGEVAFAGSPWEIQHDD